MDRVALLAFAVSAAVLLITARRRRRSNSASTESDWQTALAQADAARVAGGSNPIYSALLRERPYEGARVTARMTTPATFERLMTRQTQRDPAKGCIDPSLLGTPAGRDHADVTLHARGGDVSLRLPAFLAHLVSPDTLWDPEADSTPAITAMYAPGGAWTGTLLWDSAVLTAELLLADERWARRLRSATVCELGCGLGLPGLVCHHALGASKARA